MVKRHLWRALRPCRAPRGPCRLPAKSSQGHGPDLAEQGASLARHRGRSGGHRSAGLACWRAGRLSSPGWRGASGLGRTDALQPAAPDQADSGGCQALKRQPLEGAASPLAPVRPKTKPITLEQRRRKLLAAGAGSFPGPGPGPVLGHGVGRRGEQVQGTGR